MNKALLFTVIVVVAIAGFFVYKNMSAADQMTPETTTGSAGNQTAAPLSPVFSQLSVWAPNASWGNPEQTTEETPYGNLSGMRVEGKVAGNETGTDNLHDQPFMSTLGFVEDIKFAADGPGASNWGYKKTENGQMQVVIFRYSTQRLLGPETTEPPFVNLSAFVSDPFTQN